MRKPKKTRPRESVAELPDVPAPFYVYVQGVRRKITPVAPGGPDQKSIVRFVHATVVPVRPPRRRRSRGKRA